MSTRILLCTMLVVLTAVLAIADDTSPQSAGPSTTQPARRSNFGQRLREMRAKKVDSNVDVSKLKHLTWKVGDDTRAALVYLPPAAAGKRPPVVFAFHGHGGNMNYSARKFAIHELWPEAICVYPQGLPTAVPVIDVDGKKNGWQKYVGDQNDRDLAFFDAMMKTLKADYQMDESHVFVMGHSNGGFFSYVLWAARGDEITALAPIAANINPRDLKLFKPKPVFHIAGEKDPLVKFDLQERTIEQDKKLNGCDVKGKPIGDLCTEYASKTGTPVVTMIHPGGHEVPDGAMKRIVEFFKRF
ncbi:hypothetical protein BH10PLA1_BH10PLA1_10360 [soil metagenome]